MLAGAKVSRVQAYGGVLGDWQGSGDVEKRAHVDLASARVRSSPQRWEPAYVRVRGAWANSMFFQDTDAVETGARLVVTGAC